VHTPVHTVLSDDAHIIRSNPKGPVMDTLTRQLENVARALQQLGVDDVHEIPVIADAVRGTHPVVAEVLMSTTDPEVARLRAFSVADRVLRSYDGQRRETVSDALAHAGVVMVPTSRSFARAA
jgi:hypothetical protein